MVRATTVHGEAGDCVMNVLGYFADALISAGAATAIMSFIQGGSVDLAGVAVVVAALIYFGLYFLMRGSRLRLVALYAVSVALMLFWVFYSGIFSAIAASLSYYWFVVRRVRLLRGEMESYVQVRYLLLDLIPTGVALLLSLSGSETLSLVTSIVALGTLLRLFAMRSATIAIAKEEGITHVPSLRVPLFSALAILFITGYALVAFPALRMLVLMGALLFIAWVWLKSENKAGLLIVLLILLLLFVRPNASAVKGMVPNINLHGLAHLKTQHAIHQANLQNLGQIIGYVLLAIGMIAFTIWAFKHKADQKKVIDSSVAPVITRTRLKPNRARHGVAPTPLRKLVVRWLLFHRERTALMPGETLRTYLRRLGLADLATPGEPSATLSLRRDLVIRYEEERYGQRVATEAEAQDFEDQMQSAGELPNPTHAKKRT